MQLDIDENKKILVVTPHPDDESIGCGGLLATYGNQCDILLLTDGHKGHVGSFDKREEELVLLRWKELQAAAKISNVRNVLKLNIPDGQVAKHFRSISSLDYREYDYIFVPNKYESHPDHKVVFKFFRKIKRKCRGKYKIIQYEVWTPIQNPLYYLDISDVINTKKQMIEQHKTQLMDIDYVSKALGLSCYRGIYDNVKYAEVFTVEENNSLLKKVYSWMPMSIKESIRKLYR